MGVTSAIKSRASTQSSATVETKKGKIQRVYVDANGNVNAGDVLIQGETTAMVALSNASGVKFRLYDNVLVNFPRGQPLAGQIIGFSGGASSAAAQASTPASSGTTTTAPPDVTAVPFMLAGPDETIPDGYVEVAGANVSLAYQDPGTVAGSVNGQATVSAQPTLATTNLPDPTNAALPSNTCLDLADSSANPLGMFRLDGSVTPRVWRRRDAGGGTYTPPSATMLVFVEDETPGGTINGANTNFTLLQMPYAATLQVFINGLRQRTSMYTQSGTALTFTDAPQPGDSVACYYEYGTPPPVNPPIFVQDETPAGTIDGTNTNFTLAGTPASRTFEVFINGLRQGISMFNQSGSSLSFTDAPQPGDQVGCFYQTGTTTAGLLLVTRELVSGTADGSNAAFSLAFTPANGSEQIFVNGILQNAGSGADYTLAGQAANFTNPPPAGAIILATYYH